MLLRALILTIRGRTSSPASGDRTAALFDDSDLWRWRRLRQGLWGRMPALGGWTKIGIVRARGKVVLGNSILGGRTGWVGGSGWGDVVLGILVCQDDECGCTAH